jgi:hypothetical protein
MSSSSSSASPEPAPKLQPKQKAGGTGKKGKTFMEDKVSFSFVELGVLSATDLRQSSLLSLVSGITASKDAAAKSKVDKIKPLIKPTPPATGGNKSGGKAKGGKAMRAFGGAPGEKKKSSAGDIKRAEREKALVSLSILYLAGAEIAARKGVADGAGGR